MKNNWIKAQITKPDNDRIVIVTFLNLAMGRRYVGFAWYSHDEQRWKMNDKGVQVIAWQERPDVYKGE